jgi:hypothetical protein
MLHEGREVLEGEKWVIRSDLCVRRNNTRELGALTDSQASIKFVFEGY